MFYLDLLRSLEQHQVRYLLVGGLAMNLHGIPRMTMDVDIFLALDAANLQDFLKVVDDLELEPALPVSLSDLADPVKRDVWIKQRNMIAFSMRGPNRETPSVDVLIGATLSFDEAYGRREIRELSGVKVCLASLQDMISLKKQAGRQQDMADIEHLERLQNKK